jgi:hypothetical protein
LREDSDQPGRFAHGPEEKWGLVGRFAGRAIGDFTWINTILVVLR